MKILPFPSVEFCKFFLLKTNSFYRHDQWATQYSCHNRGQRCQEVQNGPLRQSRMAVFGEREGSHRGEQTLSFIQSIECQTFRGKNHVFLPNRFCVFDFWINLGDVRKKLIRHPANCFLSGRCNYIPHFSFFGFNCTSVVVLKLSWWVSAIKSCFSFARLLCKFWMSLMLITCLLRLSECERFNQSEFKSNCATLVINILE